MKRLKKEIHNNINISSQLEAKDVKSHLNFNNNKSFRLLWNWKRTGAFAMLMIALVFGFGLNQGDGTIVPVRALNSVVTLDINPGVLINLDENNEVISVEALNADAETLLLDVDVTLTNLDDLVANIIQVAEDQDFLIEDDTILFSVQSEDDELNNQLEQEITSTVDEEAEKLGKQFETVVNKYKEIIDTESSVISQAKATLIEALLITGDYSLDDVDELADMKVNDIKDLLEESYGVVIQEIVSEDNDDTPGQLKKREKYVNEILEQELLTIEEIAVTETKDLHDVLKEYYEIKENQVKETAELAVEETDRQKYIETLSGLGLLSVEELQAMDVDDLEDMLEDYYESIEEDEEAKEKAKEKAKEAKEKIEEAKEKVREAEDEAEDVAEELYEDISKLTDEYEQELEELNTELLTNRENMTEEEIAELEAEIAELTVEFDQKINELKTEAEEKIASTMNDAIEDVEDAELKANKIQLEAIKNRYKYEIKQLTSVEEANSLLEEITVEFNDNIASLEIMLEDTSLNEDTIDEINDQIEDLQDDYKDLEEDITELISEIDEEESKAELEARKNQFEAITEQYKYEIEQLISVEGANLLLDEITGKFNENIANLEVMLEGTPSNEDAIDEIKDQIEDLQDDFEDLEEEILDFISDLEEEESESELGARKNQFEAITEQYEHEIEQLISVEGANLLLDEITAQFNENIADLEIMLEDTSLHEDAIDEVKDQIDDLEEDYEDLKKDILDFISDLDEEAQEDEAEKQEEIQKLEEELVNLELEYDIKLAELEEELEAKRSELSDEEIEEYNDKINELNRHYEKEIEEVNGEIDEIKNQS
ncbi:hypothetical protein KHQ82_10640 [Mycoplasmatota bacterium]|nr:hypothetical protein KHQ82_10640 [Mycoplasmatota bacterium]